MVARMIAWWWLIFAHEKELSHSQLSFFRASMTKTFHLFHLVFVFVLVLIQHHTYILGVCASVPHFDQQKHVRNYIILLRSTTCRVVSFCVCCFFSLLCFSPESMTICTFLSFGYSFCHLPLNSRVLVRCVYEYLLLVKWSWCCFAFIIQFFGCVVCVREKFGVTWNKKLE